MRRNSWVYPRSTVGLDLGDRKSVICELDAAATVVKRATVATTRAAMCAYFGRRSGSRVVLEAGTHSPWVSRMLEELGHEAVVANPSAVYGPRRRKKRNDRMDAEFLARQGRADVQLLHPIEHRRLQAQEHLAVIRARDQLVRSRTKLINHVRGSVKAQGDRIGRCSTESFPRQAHRQVPGEMRIAVFPLLDVIAELTTRIHDFDRPIQAIVVQSYPEALRLQQLRGVGALTALAFVLLVDDPYRFTRSRDVGACFGLVPRLDESGDGTPQLRITKAGDELGRRLLVSAARYILGPHGPDCDLRRHGQKMAERGGKIARKRAAIAVARKLAVLLHRLWVSAGHYDPDRQLRRRAA